MSVATSASAANPSSSIVKTPRQQIANYQLWVRTFQVALPVLAIVVWELVSGPIWSPFWISKPSFIWRELLVWISDGSLFDHILATFQEMILGFLLGASLGAIVGFILGVKTSWLRVLQPF